MNIVVTGATGLIGSALCRALAEDGHHITGLTRSSNRLSGLPQLEFRNWQPMAGPPDQDTLAGADAIVHLAGESIAARRWTESQKKLIRDSRVVSTRNLVSTILAMDRKPQVFAISSAVGFYGNRGDEQLEEDSPPGGGFLADVCKEWEHESERASEGRVRSVQVRVGVVLSSKGGALERMAAPFKMGVGGPLGSGRQWFPWIHIKDVVGIFRHAVITSSMAGPVNCVAPEPVTNAEFTRALAKVLHRPAFLPVPEFALRALMGEMADLLFVSQRVVPTAALASGYEFHYPLLTKALENLLAEKAEEA